MQKFYDHFFESRLKPGQLIFVQTEAEAKIGRGLIESVRRRWFIPPYFYHLKAGGHIAALQIHKSDRYFARQDLTSFFGSVSRNKVCQTLKKIGFSFFDANAIAHRSCVMLDGKRTLPYGYVQSPVLASVVLDKSALGQELKRLHASEVNVSVFMDDITLSHATSLDPLHAAVAALSKSAEASRFVISKDKAQGPSELVTAFNIDVQSEALTITRSRYEELAERISAQGKCPSTDGILGYVRQINPHQFSQLRDLA
jgi:hypothetical protein